MPPAAQAPPKIAARTLVPRKPTNVGTLEDRRAEMERRGREERYEVVAGTWFAERARVKKGSLEEFRRAGYDDASIDRMTRDGLMIRLA